MSSVRDPAALDSQYDVFVRKARNAAKQSLFFLYDLQGLELSSFTADAKFALRQARSLVDGVHIPRRFADDKTGAHPCPPAAVATQRPGFLKRVVDFFIERDGLPDALFDLNDRLIGDRNSAERIADFMHDGRASDKAWSQQRQAAREQIFAFWTKCIWTRLHAIECLDEPTLKELILQLQAFLRITRPTAPTALFTMWVQKLGVFMLRNAAVIFGLIALSALWMQEVLSSLVLNSGLASVWPVAFVVLSAAVSFGIGTRGPNRVGKRAFFRVAYEAHEPERGISSWPDPGELRKQIGWSEITKAAAMLVLILGSSAVFFLWADPTRRTLFVLAALSWSTLIALHWLDLWDFLDPRPIRFFVLLGLGLLALGVLTSWHRAATYFLFGLLFVCWALNSVRKQRVTAVGVSMAVTCFLVLVSVGWGHYTLDQSAWRSENGEKSSVPRVAASAWPFPSRLAGGVPAPVVVVAASGGGSRAAIYTALTLRALHRDLPQVANHLQAISSVSGGSLASAAYIAKRFCESHPQWDALVKETSQDFLYPTIMGALKPWSSRGLEVESYWDDHAGLRGLTLSKLATAWSHRCAAAAESGDGAEVHPPFPLPLFNACTLDGHAAVISPLERGGYLDAYDDASRAKELRAHYAMDEDVELTWVQDRDGVYPLEALSAGTNPRLSQAVRASANFPFGFPLVDVHTDSEYGPQWIRPRAKLASLTDGGVLSNSGLWTLFHLLTHSSHREALLQRGVLLIVVDASKMPVYAPDRQNFASLYGAIQDSDPVAQNLHRRMFEQLFLVYGNAMQIVKVDLIPSVRDNVYTTWALDEESQKKLARSFECVWSNPDAAAKARDRIATSWEILTKHATETYAQVRTEDTEPEPPSCGLAGTETSFSAALDADGVSAAKRRATAAVMLRPPLD